MRTNGSEIDFSQLGHDWIGDTVRTDIMKPTAWVVSEFESIDQVEGKKKYILGAKASATRPFESAAKFISDFTLKN